MSTDETVFDFTKKTGGEEDVVEGEENTIVGVTGAGANEPVVVEEDNKNEVIDAPVDKENKNEVIDAPVKEEKEYKVIGAPVKKPSIRKIDNFNDVKPGETAYKIVKTAGGDVVVKDSNENVVTDTIDDETKNTIFDFINPPASMGQAGGRRRSRRNRRQNGKRQSKKRQQNRQSKKQKQNGGKKRRNSKRNQKK